MQILCPQCGRPIEVAKLTPQQELACPSCGSSFLIEMEVAVTCRPQSRETARREVDGIGRIWQVGKRRPLVAVLACAAVVLLLVVPAVVSHLVRSLEESRRNEAAQRQLLAEQNQAAAAAEQETRRQAQAARAEAHRQALEINEASVQAYVSQAQAERTARHFGRQKAALDLIQRAAALQAESQELVDQLGENSSGWPERLEQFWTAQRPKLAREAVHWISTSSLESIRELRFPKPARSSTGSFGGAAPTAAAASPDAACGPGTFRRPNFRGCTRSRSPT